jgi:MoaA/NifB/PqqE/SkfB family radical SAM enzyme
MIDGKQYTSNLAKLVKHLDKLKDVQSGKPVGPVMVHLALTNRCNLNCSYCCYGGRDKGQELTKEQAFNIIDQFDILGTKGLEITGGGDPLLHPDINEIVRYGKRAGMSIGLITNGIAYEKFSEWNKLDWIRISSHALNYNNPDLQVKFREAIQTAQEVPGLDVGSVHIYTGSDIALESVVLFMEHYKVPTRITPDLTKSPEWIKTNMEHAGDLLKNKFNAKYSFISDFNIKFSRENNNCWMHLVKPYIHPDGNVYVCPGASFSPENFCNVDPKYKLCSIEDIVKTYTDTKNVKAKDYDCRFCKYQVQNELFNDITRETNHNDFA